LKGTAKSTTVGKTLIKAVARKAPPEAERLPLRIRIASNTKIYMLDRNVTLDEGRRNYLG